MTTYAAGMVLRAAEALRSNPDTFTPKQVAFLLDLAFRSGFDAGYETGSEVSVAGFYDDLRRALGGLAETETLGQATAVHHNAVQRMRARQEWLRHAYEERPHGLVLDDPQWPPVKVPGEQPTQLPNDHDNRPATGRHLQRVA